MRILRPCRIWILATVIWIGYTTLSAILDYDHILRNHPVYFLFYAILLPISVLFVGKLAKRILGKWRLAS